MTLDPVHFKTITRLAGSISHEVDEREHRKFAETVWNEFLDPLMYEGRAVIEPLADLRRRKVDIEDAALSEDQFPTQHGLDSGTINPTTFKNGLTVDVAVAAMSAVPSDLDLHRCRTIVKAVHSNEATVHFGQDWQVDDEGYVKSRVLHVPRANRSVTVTPVVHELALYLAEVEHAHGQAELVEDLLVMDGPIYPKGLLTWENRNRELADLLAGERTPREVIGEYVGLVESFMRRDVPVVGFVKTPMTGLLTRIVREKQGSAPWVNDAAFFSQVLERGEWDADGHYERHDDHLTFTNWFVSRGSADRAIVEGRYDLTLAFDPEEYEVTFCMVYDPRTDTVYRVEAPRAFTADEERREALTRQVLKDLATERGPPAAVAKADSLASISRKETVALRRALEEALDADMDTTYNDERWGVGSSFGL
jgi:hypothetical protein